MMGLTKFWIAVSLLLSCAAVFGADSLTPGAAATNESKDMDDAVTVDTKAVKFYDLVATKGSGELVPLKQYRGKVTLVANTASKCGYTPQYEALQKIQTTYENKGLVVLGFPSNDFKQQEPGTDKEIQSFCKLNYGVTFPLFQKAPVTGDKIQPVFAYLTKNSPADEQGEVKWNFEKFVVDRKGDVVARFPSKVKPDDPTVVAALEKALAEPVPQAPQPASKNKKVK
jgi:glutathione peroxidase